MKQHIQFIYWIVFHYKFRLNKGLNQVDSITELSADYTIPHLLERDIASILPIIWYTLHLPRRIADFVCLPWSILANESLIDLPTNIITAPIPGLEEPSWRSLAKDYEPDLLFYPDDFDVGTLKELFPTVQLVPFSDAVPEHLEAHWEYLSTMAEPATNRTPLPFYTKSDEGARFLATAHYARQLPNGMNQRVRSLGIAAAFWHHDRVLTTARQLNQRAQEADIKTPSSAFILNDDSAIHVAIACPGVRNHEFQWMTPAWNQAERSDADTESLAFDCMLAHRSNACSGAGLRGFVITTKLMRELAAIELHYRQRQRRKAIKFRILLRRFGLMLRDLLMQQLGDLAAEQMTVIRRALSLTAFTSFPIGLMQFNSGDTPLCMAVPIAYRPAYPTGSILISECVATVRRMTEIHVLVLQCVSPKESELIQYEADHWGKVDALLQAQGTGRAHLVMIANIADIAAHIENTRPNILVVSGHGEEFEYPRATGIRAGDAYLVGVEFEYVPPVVILSSCNVNARGRGSLSISELLLRNGAVTVIGALIPIDYRRNADLLMTLFRNLSDAIKLHDPSITWLDVWQIAVVENAIHDILYCSDRVLAWGKTAVVQGMPLVRYLVEKRGAEISTGRVYEDALQLIQECADATGFGAVFRSTISSQWYLPESSMYQIIGWPERIRIARHRPGS